MLFRLENARNRSYFGEFSSSSPLTESPELTEILYYIKAQHQREKPNNPSMLVQQVQRSLFPTFSQPQMHTAAALPNLILNSLDGSRLHTRTGSAAASSSPPRSKPAAATCAPAPMSPARWRPAAPMAPDSVRENIQPPVRRWPTTSIATTWSWAHGHHSFMAGCPLPTMRRSYHSTHVRLFMFSP